jgi:hypothetical protein
VLREAVALVVAMVDCDADADTEEESVWLGDVEGDAEELALDEVLAVNEGEAAADEEGLWVLMNEGRGGLLCGGAGSPRRPAGRHGWARHAAPWRRRLPLEPPAAVRPRWSRACSIGKGVGSSTPVPPSSEVAVGLGSRPGGG